MTEPCPRCAELERRLSESEREMFEALRARVEELKEKLQWALKEIDEHNREYKYVTEKR